MNLSWLVCGQPPGKAGESVYGGNSGKFGFSSQAGQADMLSCCIGGKNLVQPVKLQKLRQIKNPSRRQSQYQSNGKQLKISIITPVLNGERFIRDTVESVLSQAGDFELEYIVRDGGSRDGTLTILAEYRNRCAVISEPDGSPQEAVNAGMAMATGDICAWLNADDLYEPGALQAISTILQSRPDCQWCYGRCRIIDENGCEIRKPVTIYKNLLGWNYSENLLLCENYINQPATFWRRALWDRAGGLNVEFKASFDYDLWLRMGQIARPVASHKYLAAFRRHPDSISENAFIRQFDEELQIASSRGNAIHHFIHRLNRWKIVQAYKLMR